MKFFIDPCGSGKWLRRDLQLHASKSKEKTRDPSGSLGRCHVDMSFLGSAHNSWEVVYIFPKISLLYIAVCLTSFSSKTGQMHILS